MMWIMCVCLAGLAQSETVSQSDQALAGTLSVRLETHAPAIRPFDPLCVRVTVTNESEETIGFDLFLCRNARYKYYSEPFRYQFPSYRYAHTHPDRYPLAPGETRIVDLYVLQCPPLDQLDHDFWFRRSDRRLQLPDHLTAEVVSADPNIQALLPRRAAYATLGLVERDEEITGFIQEMYGGMCDRQEKVERLRIRSPKTPFSLPNPGWLGLSGYWRHEEFTEQLMDHVDDYEEGSFRDALHITRLLRIAHAESDESRRIDVVNEVLRFMDELPEVERQCFAKELIGNADLLKGPAAYGLTEGLVRRSPEKCYQCDDYHEYLRKTYGGGGFFEYLEEHKDDMDPPPLPRFSRDTGSLAAGRTPIRTQSPEWDGSSSPGKVVH